MPLTCYFLFRFNEFQKIINNQNLAIKNGQDALMGEEEKNRNQQDFITKELKSRDELLKSERKRIAADLHDDIIQRLVVLRMRLEQLLYFTIPGRAEIEVKQLHHELENIMGDMRYLIHDLVHPKFDKYTFTALIERLVQRLGCVLHRKVELVLHAEDQEFFIPSPIKRELYYIIQEATQNSLSHSVALTLRVSLSWKEGLLVIVEDDGQGLLERGRGEGYGFSSIQRRAVAIGATLQIKSTSRGLAITVEWKKS